MTQYLECRRKFRLHRCANTLLRAEIHRLPGISLGHLRACYYSIKGNQHNVEKCTIFRSICSFPIYSFGPPDECYGSLVFAKLINSRSMHQHPRNDQPVTINCRGQFFPFSVTPCKHTHSPFQLQTEDHCQQCTHTYWVYAGRQYVFLLQHIQCLGKLIEHVSFFVAPCFRPFSMSWAITGHSHSLTSPCRDKCGRCYTDCVIFYKLMTYSSSTTSGQALSIHQGQQAATRSYISRNERMTCTSIKPAQHEDAF